LRDEPLKVRRPANIVKEDGTAGGVSGALDGKPGPATVSLKAACLRREEQASIYPWMSFRAGCLNEEPFDAILPN